MRASGLQVEIAIAIKLKLRLPIAGATGQPELLGDVRSAELLRRDAHARDEPQPGESFETFSIWFHGSLCAKKRKEDDPLNRESICPQAAAVENATRRRLTLIQGPPGTGKTRTAAEVVRTWVLEGRTPVLLCADSNIAVDNLCEAVAAMGQVRPHGFFLLTAFEQSRKCSEKAVKGHGNTMEMQ